MANSKYAYVRDFELPDPLLPGAYTIFRLDGHSFHRFSEQHQFTKPNDVRALRLMDHCAKDLMSEYPDIMLAFGESDEFSFLLRRSTTLYNRRESKIVSTLTSLFTSCYVFHWPEYFPNFPLQYPPSFDGRIVLYPAERHIRDYFAWRQTDTHINNLYNTVFWALVQQGGQSTSDAHATLRGTFSKDKNEILFSRFGINYNQVDPQFRKGSVLVREKVPSEKEEDPMTPSFSNYEVATASNIDINDATPITPEAINKGGVVELNIPSPVGTHAPRNDNNSAKKKSKLNSKAAPPKTRIEILHCDIIKDEFWEARTEILQN